MCLSGHLCVYIWPSSTQNTAVMQVCACHCCHCCHGWLTTCRREYRSISAYFECFSLCRVPGAAVEERAMSQKLSLRYTSFSALP